VLQAAILHDVLEDTDCSFQELQLAFGSEVADVVMVRSILSTFLSLVDKERDAFRSRAHHLSLVFFFRNVRMIVRSGDWNVKGGRSLRQLGNQDELVCPFLLRLFLSLLSSRAHDES